MVNEVKGVQSVEGTMSILEAATAEGESVVA